MEILLFPVVYNLLRKNKFEKNCQLPIFSNQKRRAKRLEEYSQNRDDELESTRVWYNADPEKKSGRLLVTATEQILKKIGRL